MSWSVLTKHNWTKYTGKGQGAYAKRRRPQYLTYKPVKEAHHKTQGLAHDSKQCASSSAHSPIFSSLLFSLSEVRQTLC